MKRTANSIRNSLVGIMSYVMLVLVNFVSRRIFFNVLGSTYLGLNGLFTNIIANALKHSADGTTVLVDAHEDENQGTIVTNVVNFGSQIAPSDRLDIFRRFVKGKTGPGTESGGTGLGLSIARWAAQLHGGTVKVVDDTRGADFEIILPKYHIAER